LHSAYELIAAAASRTPGQPALVDDLTGLSFTYGELLDEVDAVAAALAERGVARGMRFATVLPNNIEHCLTILALARIGAVPALMNVRLPPGELAQLMDQAGVVGALLLPDPTLVAATREVVGSSGTVLCAGGATEGAEAFGECRGDVDSLPPVPEVERDELAYIFYTSGTTGLPKGVLLCHKTTLPRIVWISSLTGVRAGTHIRTLGLAPLSHAIGFYGNFLMSLAYSGTYFTSSIFDPESVLSCIEKNEISLVFTVPTFYFALMSAPGYRPERLSSIRNLMWGRATIRPDLLRSINEDLDVTTTHLYGTTETIVSLYNHAPGDEPTRLRPGPFSSVRLVEFGGGPLTWWRWVRRASCSSLLRPTPSSTAIWSCRMRLPRRSVTAGTTRVTPFGSGKTATLSTPVGWTTSSEVAVRTSIPMKSRPLCPTIPTSAMWVWLVSRTTTGVRWSSPVLSLRMRLRSVSLTHGAGRGRWRPTSDPGATCSWSPFPGTPPTNCSEPN